MNQKDRIVRILDMLKTRQKISQDKLIELFSISRDTARRDILKLVESGLAERYPGGVSQPIFKHEIENYSNRLIKQAKEKRKIAEIALSLINSQMVIYLDVSTTVNFLALDLKQNDLTIVTNSIDNALGIVPEIKPRVYLLGGSLNLETRVLYGELLLQQIRPFNFDYSFIGAGGITKEGIFYSELTDVYLKKEIINNSQKVCLLVDSTKVNKRSAYKIDFSGIDLIITDKPFPKELMEKLKSKNIKVLM